MKKITFLVALTFSLFANAQPILNASDFPTAYSTSGYYSNSITGFTNGSAGANVVWDFSAIIPSSTVITYSVVPVSETAASVNFPSANFCEKFEYNGTPEYWLYKLDNQSFELVAAVTTFVANYYDSEVIFQFPYTYQSEFTDTVWQLGQPTPPEPITRTYDGYGTLILPNGTYNNVIRQKIVNGFGQVEYYWYGTSPYRLLMGGNLDFNYARVFGEATLNNTPVASSKFNLHPNPTTDSFSVTTSSEERLSLKVYDAVGKQLLESNHYIPGSLISLREFANGVYIVKLLDVNSKEICSRKIIKN